VTDLDNVPPSVRLGEVVPPEDPEDWGSPLTWVVAAGMLVAPLVAALWFLLATPADPAEVVGGIAALAAVLAAGAAVTGATQKGARRAGLTTVGAGLFGALGAVVVGSVVADGAALGIAASAAVAGVIGCAPAATLAALLAGAGRARRVVSPALAGGATAVLVAQLLFRL
jgi:hypothetical protein